VLAVKREDHATKLNVPSISWPIVVAQKGAKVFRDVHYGLSIL
jgi:hypothetical protein